MEFPPKKRVPCIRNRVYKYDIYVGGTDRPSSHGLDRIADNDTSGEQALTQ